MRIRELRFGPAKSGKTKNVLESYPTPLLVINTEIDGLQSVKTRPIQSIKCSDLDTCISKPKEQLPPITAIDLIYGSVRRIGTKTTPGHTVQPFHDIAGVINKLLDKCPFETVVLDSITGLSDICIGLVATLNPEWYEGGKSDARKWAGAAGAKVVEVVGAVFGLNCTAAVVIGHDSVTTNDKTGETRTLPICPGFAKERLGSLASQYFYSDTEIQGNGTIKYIIRTVPFGMVKGLGQRLNDQLPSKCGPRYEDIYGGLK